MSRKEAFEKLRAEIPGCREIRTIFVVFDGICDRAYDNGGVSVNSFSHPGREGRLSFLPSYYLNESYGMGTNVILAGTVSGVILTVEIFTAIRRYSEKEEQLYESIFNEDVTK